MTQATGEVVRDYLARFPSASSRKLAEMIFVEAPGLFTTPERARDHIRYYRGAHGDKSRADMAAASYMPRISAPVAEDEDFEPYILSLQDYPIIVGADAHVPYHDQDAVEIFIERAIAIKANTVILLGDWLDCYQISRFLKDPRKRQVADEIAMLRGILETIRKARQKAKIVYKFGNHEERYDAYICANAPGLFGLDSVHLENLPELGLKNLGVECVTNKRIIQAGHLSVIHGHEYVFSISNPVNPARGLYLRAKRSAMCAHFHQSSEHTETAITGEVATTWSLGALCGLHPQYMPLNKWNLGLAEIGDDDGLFNVRNRRIVNYRIV